MNINFIGDLLERFIGKQVTLRPYSDGSGSCTGKLRDLKRGAESQSLEFTLTTLKEHVCVYDTKNYPNLLEPSGIVCDGKSLQAIVLQEVNEMETLSQRKRKIAKYEGLAKSFRRAETLDPVVLLTDSGDRLEAEKVFLVARSPVFARMLQTNMKEKQTGEVLITGYSRDALALFLDIVHARDVDLTRLKENIEQVVKLLDLYEVGCLIELTGLEAKEFVNVENVADILFLAGNHRQPGLLRYTWKVVRENKGVVLESERWQQLIRAGFGGLDGKCVMALVDAS